MDLGKKDEKGKPHDNFGNEDGKVDKAVQDSPIFITVFVKGERCGRAENGGHAVEMNPMISVLASASATWRLLKSWEYHLNVKPAHTAFMRESLKEYRARIRMGR